MRYPRHTSDVLTAVLPLLCMRYIHRKNCYQKHAFACHEYITTPHSHGCQEEFCLLITSEAMAWEWREDSTLLTDSLVWEHRTITSFIFCVRTLRVGGIKKINKSHAYKSFKFKWKQKKNKSATDSITNSTLDPVRVLWREAKQKREIRNYPVPLNISINNC